MSGRVCGSRYHAAHRRRHHRDIAGACEAVRCLAALTAAPDQRSAVPCTQAELQATFRPELSQQHGFWHGGIIATLADNASGFAACSLVPLSSQVLAAQMNLHWVAPAVGPVLTAVAEVVKPGRSQSVVAFRVYCGEADGPGADHATGGGGPHVGAAVGGGVVGGSATKPATPKRRKLVAVGTHTVAVLARRYADKGAGAAGGEAAAPLA